MKHSIVLSLVVVMSHTTLLAQEETDVMSQYFQMLMEQYAQRTGDSLTGPISGEAAETRSNILFDAEKYTEAIPHFTALTRKYPTDWNYYRMAYCYYMTDQHQLAIEYFTKSISRFPDPLLSPWWVGPLVRLDSDTKKYYKNASVSLQHQYIDAYLFRAESKAALRDYYGSIVDINNYFVYMNTDALRSEVTESNAHRLSGFCRIQTADWSNAIKDLQASVSQNPKNKEAYYYLGYALIQTDATPEGCLALSRAGELGLKEAYEMINEYCTGGR